MEIKHCTDVDGSMIPQHLFVFVDLCFLSDNDTKTGRNEQGERRSITSLQSPTIYLCGSPGNEQRRLIFNRHGGAFTSAF